MRAVLDADLAHREDVMSLFLHEMACDRLRSMLEHCERIREATPASGPQYADAVRSLHACLASLLRFGFGQGQYVTTDLGPLDLYVQTDSGFVFGINWHRDRTFDGTPHEGLFGTWSVNS